MSDIFTPEKRSSIMSKVHSKENKSTELKLIRYFKENGIHGWKRGYKVKGRTMPSIGKKRESETWLTIKKLQPYLKIADGRLFVFGNAN